MKILNFGSLNLDYVYHVEHFVRPGETLASTDYRRFCGGKGLNQSIALACAGADAYHAGVIGREGGILKETLEKYGVHTDYVVEKDVMNGHAVIQVDRRGQNCILLYGGSNQSVTKGDIESTLAHFGEGEILVLQNEIIGLEEIIRSAHQRGMKIALNPSPIGENLKKLPLRDVGLFVLNDIEGAGLTGETEPEKILDALANRFPESTAVLTLGGKGAMYRDRRTFARHGVYQVEVKDTTAAGDTFTGYFIACLAENMPPEAALEKASVAAAIAVSRPGSSSSIPLRAEVDGTHLKPAE